MTDGADALRRALEQLRTTGGVSPLVRPEIVASWERSMGSDLDPRRFEVPHDSQPHVDDRFQRAARPVLARLRDDLETTSMGIVLSNAHGDIVDRYTHDRVLQAHLDRISLAPGFSYAENLIGTNAIGTALESRTPSTVFGSEHYADALVRMAGAAAPIVDPTTASVVGVIDLTCRVEAAHTLMLAVATRAARDIEQRLLTVEPGADRVLLETFLRARRRARAPLIALNQRTMYTNAAAARIVHDMERDLLWSAVSATLADRDYAEPTLPVPHGSTSVVSLETVEDGGEVAGVLVRFPPRVETRGGLAVPERRRARPSCGWESLTETERIIAELVSEGRTNRETATSTFLSPHTVGYHLRHIFHKLGVESRVELTRLIVQRANRDNDPPRDLPGSTMRR
jgi:DNA-binding CsgD family transcriptional regulator